MLTVYSRRSVTVGCRVLQAVASREFLIERFIADFSNFNHKKVKGLEQVTDDVMRTTVVISLQHPADQDRIGKSLNRVVDVYKVEHTYRI
ncbi:hypothetical protein ASD11_15135 [Aeromicrobium sp. Root495]|nr:hypothetical protein ASD11_15135 [Aeromicrobium sp. Root495]